MNREQEKFWIDLGFITGAAENWATLLVMTKSKTFATNAEEFKAEIHDTCERVKAYARKVIR